MITILYNMNEERIQEQMDGEVKFGGLNPNLKVLYFDQDTVTEQDVTNKLNEDRIAEIYAELAELDRFLPRSTEDLIETGKISIEDLSVFNINRYNKKVELRNELQDLY